MPPGLNIMKRWAACGRIHSHCSTDAVNFQCILTMLNADEKNLTWITASLTCSNMVMSCWAGIWSGRTDRDEWQKLDWWRAAAPEGQEQGRTGPVQTCRSAVAGCPLLCLFVCRIGEGRQGLRMVCAVINRLPHAACFRTARWPLLQIELHRSVNSPHSVYSIKHLPAYNVYVIVKAAEIL